MGLGRISFSQAQGYEEIPRPLKLEEFPREARNRIWNLFYAHLRGTTSSVEGFGTYIGGAWRDVFLSVHAELDCLPLDDWETDFELFCSKLRGRIGLDPFFKVFDLIEFVLQHPQCPPPFVKGMDRTFKVSRLAYVLDTGPPPSIIPAVTPVEGTSVVESLKSLRQAGLGGSTAHLRSASAYINEGKWADSVRESIHAVESVARQLDPNAAQTLGPALKSQPLHPALKKGIASLYGYTADEQGIRHALLDQTDANVGQDEAVFMLGACASFASYLIRKHVAGAKS